MEEQQRRENNIQAGNPFKQFGYKPKIATLSKGKYLEFHDLDSIVKIGSFTYHVKRKSITGYTKLETRYSEATLNPEIISRWMSPDPLSSEFPNWSPYNFVMNSPLILVDPTGLAPEWIPQVNENGSTSYIAEKGDNANTLASQYGLKQDVADNLYATLDNGEISGADTKSITGSDVMELNMQSDMATEQRVFDQFVFATDYTFSKGEFDFKPSEFFKNRSSSLSQTSGKANLNGVDIYYDITLYNPNEYSNWSKTNEFPISNHTNEHQPTSGLEYKNVFFFYRVTNSGKHARSDGAKIYYNGNENYNKIYNRFKRD
ncbi:hypothetical protein [Formosa maritima]|uniref:RHS repeat-associated core domain-containing protein n=1 Tax=Formosa maritima TaxID=2592046 RepID=A0A5D0GCQ3_9FLAO|nr:hypothetical protein [Formosa maritima]TYA56798.1 hypothetical protein FVF61_05580 [Formosa maritima]